MRLRGWMLGLLALFVPAFAAPPPADAPTTDWSTSTPELVVVRPGGSGPALWHVATPTSEIWILATVSPMPKDLKWDQSGIADLLKGANVMLLPPRATVGMAEGLWFLAWHRDTLEQPDGTTLESTLPEPMRQHFVNWRNRLERDADRYDDYLGGVAALRLEGDYFDHENFSPNRGEKDLEAMARRAGVPVHPTATYDAMDVVHDIPNMSAAAHVRCMTLALKDMDTFSAHAGAAADAWARGDVAGVKANYAETQLDACLQQSSAYNTLRETANRDMTNAILTALKTPGKSFAVMPMGFFLRKGGVLERLQAAGLTVSGPND